MYNKKTFNSSYIIAGRLQYSTRPATDLTQVVITAMDLLAWKASTDIIKYDKNTIVFL